MKIVIVGAGPAGMVAAKLLARNGHEVHVLEKNKDFEREFRGEVLQPRFLEAMKKAGLDTTIQAIENETFDKIKLFSRGRKLGEVAMSEINPQFPYITWMTQPNLLRGLHHACEEHPNFKIKFAAEVQELIWDNDCCVGVTFKTNGEVKEETCDLVIGTDGRFSRLRKLGNFDLEFSSHRFDVLWFHTKRPEGFDQGADFFVNNSFACLTLPKHPDLVQCGILMEVNQGKKYLRQGIDKIALRLSQTHPMFTEFADNLTQENQFTILQAKIERVRDWAKPGLLLIGDAAHTCSPIFAIGVTIAVESAIVTANQIGTDSQCSLDTLKTIQKLRYKHVVAVQNRQEMAAKFGVLNPVARPMIPWLAPLAFKSGMLGKAVGPVLGQSPI